MKTLDRKKLIEEDSKNKIIVSFDIEATQVDAGNGSYEHVANLLIAGNLFINQYIFTIELI